MITLEETTAQISFDCFGMLYACLSAALLQWDPARGEHTIRQAVARYALEKGTQLRLRQTQLGCSIDLQNLFAAEPCCGGDSRFHRSVIQDTKQVQRMEVLTCPLAQLWADAGCSFAGCLYCEEYAHAWMKGYTNGVGQANVSNALTYPRDDRCTLSFYYRPANMTPEQLAAFQAGTSAAKEVHLDQGILRLYHGFYQAAQEQGPGAAAALEQGLHTFAQNWRESLANILPLPCPGSRWEELTGDWDEGEQHSFAAVTEALQSE